MIPIGSIVNAVSIVIGSFWGITLARRFSPRTLKTVFNIVGILALGVGAAMVRKIENPGEIFISPTYYRR